MRTSTILRASLLAVALGAALAAHAVTIGLSSVGTSVVTATANTVNETVFPGLGQQGGYGPLSTLSYTITATGATGVYTGSGGTLLFDLSNLNEQDEAPVTALLSATWTATGGTGTYLNATGSGKLSTNITATSRPIVVGAPNASFTTFRGTIEAVPEPSALAALGLGAVGLLRRRKRA